MACDGTADWLLCRIRSGSTDFSRELRLRFPGTTFADNCLCLWPHWGPLWFFEDEPLEVDFTTTEFEDSHADLDRTFFRLIVPVLLFWPDSILELSGSRAILLNFLLRFVLGLTGEKFSFTESVSTFINFCCCCCCWPTCWGCCCCCCCCCSCCWGCCCCWCWKLTFFLFVECTRDLGLSRTVSSSESVNCRLEVPRSLVRITARVSSEELDESSLWFWEFFNKSDDFDVPEFRQVKLLVDLHLRRQTRRRLELAGPDPPEPPDSAFAELLFASSNSKAAFSSWTKASIFLQFTICFFLDGEGGSELVAAAALPRTRSRLNSCTIFCSMFAHFFLRRRLFDCRTCAKVLLKSLALILELGGLQDPLSSALVAPLFASLRISSTASLIILERKVINNAMMRIKCFLNMSKPYQ